MPRTKSLAALIEQYGDDRGYKPNSNKIPMVYKILNGSNLNEVQLIPKISKNRGIFEKFFQLFS